MEVKTLEDVLHWTTEYHQRLSECLAHCAERKEKNRASLLLDYLAKHESALAQLIRLLEQTGSANALQTDCSDYLKSRSILRHPYYGADFTDLGTNEIMDIFLQQTRQVIELYRYLYWRAETVSAQNLLKQLLELEEHQVMTMTQEAKYSCRL